MSPHFKRALTDEEKEKYGVPGQEAFEFGLDKVIEERCDEFENELEFNGFTVLEREYVPIAASVFNFKVIAARES